MTTNLQDEESAADSQPIELYLFQSPTTDYRYTSWDEDFSWSSQTYTAIPIHRASAQVATDVDPPDFWVEMPITAQLIQDHALVALPARYLTLTILRYQTTSNTVVQIWSGPVTAIAVDDDVAKVRIPALLDDALRATIPNVHFQVSCNHALYDPRCGKLRSDTGFTLATTIASLSADGRAIQLTSIGGHPDAWFGYGQIVRDTDGESRLVRGNVGTVLTLNTKFRALIVGDAVHVYAGCDHTVKTCRDKFANVARFGGFPLIPAVNLFRGGLKS